jgi:Raf kinase inhibitor-like YbhB/YbcL family protein
MQFSGPWADGATIPVEYTCDGADEVPLLTWTAPPDGTAELALSVVDVDAQGFVHWLVYGLPAEAGSVGGAEPLVDGAAEATNSFNDVGWGGPCPVPGAGPHRYELTLYVLDQQIEMPADTPTNDLLTAIEAATASSATFTGTFERP